MHQALKLHEKLKFQVRTERKVTHEILLTLQEFDLTQSYRELGYSSLYNYLVQGHGYSEGAANRRIQASRLLRQCPSAAAKIEEGKLNLSQLALAQSAIKQEEKKSGIKISKEKKQETLNTLVGKNHFETQKLLVETFPQFDMSKPKAVPTKNKTVRVQLEFSDQDWEKIQSLLAHLSHKMPDQKLESALIYWAKQVEKKKQKGNGVSSKKAALANQKTEASVLPTPKGNTNTNTNTNTTPNSGSDSDPNSDSISKSAQSNASQENSQTHNFNHKSPPIRRRLDSSHDSATIQRQKSSRRYISVKTKRQVFQQAQHKCEYVSPLTGETCNSSHYLDIDHKRPLALGGTNETANLRVLCRAQSSYGSTDASTLKTRNFYSSRSSLG